MKKEDDI
jgi:hypothetical protein